MKPLSERFLEKYSVVQYEKEIDIMHIDKVQTYGEICALEAMKSWADAYDAKKESEQFQEKLNQIAKTHGL